MTRAETLQKDAFRLRVFNADGRMIFEDHYGEWALLARQRLAGFELRPGDVASLQRRPAGRARYHEIDRRPKREP